MIYFLQAWGNNYIKIGTCRERLADRYKEVCCRSPVPLKIMGTMAGDHHGERWLHRTFRHARHHGEWFRPHRELLDYIAANTTPWTEPLPPIACGQSWLVPKKVTNSVLLHCSGKYRKWFETFARKEKAHVTILVLRALSFYGRNFYRKPPAFLGPGEPPATLGPYPRENHILIQCGPTWKEWTIWASDMKGLRMNQMMLHALERYAAERGFRKPPDHLIEADVIPPPWKMQV